MSTIGERVAACPHRPWEEMRQDAAWHFDGTAADLESATCQDCGATFSRCLECHESSAHAAGCVAAHLDAGADTLRELADST